MFVSTVYFLGYNNYSELLTNFCEIIVSCEEDLRLNDRLERTKCNKQIKSKEQKFRFVYKTAAYLLILFKVFNEERTTSKYAVT